MRHRPALLALALASAPLRLAAQQDPAIHADPKPDRVELATAEVSVPLRLEKGRPVVEVTLNGKGPFPFVLDTGAGGTILESDLAKELSLPEAGEVRIGDPIHPHAIAAKQVRVERLAVGGATFAGVIATSMENGGLQRHLGARGILGMPLFAELLLTLDYGRSELRIGRGELPAPDGKELLALGRGFGGTIRIPITVGTLALEADLDSGSAGGVSLPNKYMEQLPLEAKPVEVGRARTVNSAFVVHGATLKGSVRIGATSLENPALRFSELPVANVGNEVMRRFVLTIDQKAGRIRFVAEKDAGNSERSDRKG